MQQSTKFPKPNGKRSRPRLPMVDTPCEPNVLTFPTSPNDRPRKKCQSNSGGPAATGARLQHPLVRFDTKEGLAPRPPPRSLSEVELESPGSQSSQPGVVRAFGFWPTSQPDERSPQNLREMRESASQQQQQQQEQSLSGAGSAEYCTPQDQPVKKRTDMLLKEDVANQRISHRSRIQNKKETHSVTSEALPASLPPNQFYSIGRAPSCSSSATSGRRPSHPPSSSRMYNEFIDVREVGDGAFGTVHRARSRLDGSTYAIKKIRKAIKSTGPKEMACVLREVHALSYLQLRQPFCPHVLRYFSSWIQDGSLYIQTEYCGGGALSERLSTGSMSENELRELCRQMSLALLYLHSNKVAHLDVKPDNILESAPGSGSYRLVDFGLCIPVDVAHQSMPVLDGDSRYLAPELMNDETTHVDKVDIFALGASLLELSMGHKLPKTGDGFRAIRQGHVPNIDASVAFNDLVRSMLHPHADLRPSAQMILDSLDAAPGASMRDDEFVAAAAQRRIAQLEEELRLSKQQHDVLQKQVRQGLH